MSSDSWCSPPEITERLVELFDGPVDVDPCSNGRSIVAARQAFTARGLARPWLLSKPVDRTWYQNDPYSQAYPWTYKMLAELASGNIVEGVRLSMMSTSTVWWEDMCKCLTHNPRILALKRIPFLDPDAPVAGQRRMTCRFEPALTYFGPRSRVAKFERIFNPLTRWAAWGQS
jgi:hypothetical protein